MNKEKVEEIVFSVLNDYCIEQKIEVKLSKDTALIGRNRILDSIGLVNLIVDVETAFIDEDEDLSLTSETAMSARISPFRSVGALCNFINSQLNIEDE